MANILDSQQFFTQDPGVYNGTYIGTAAGTATISNNPSFLSHIQVLQRAGAGTVTWYDSAGTSNAVLGTYILGTNTANDTPPALMLKHNTNHGLTVVNSAGVALFVAYLP